MKRALALAAVIAFLTSCGGGGGNSAPSTPRVAASAAATSPQSGSLALTFGAQTGTASAARKPQFVSSGATSALISANRGTSTAFDVSPTSTMCITVSSVRTCTIPLTLPVGNNFVSVALVAGTVLLGSGSNTVNVTNGSPFSATIGVNPIAGSQNTISFSSGSTLSFTLGTPSTVTATVLFNDPARVPITGSGNVPNFLTPITLTSNDPHVTVSPSQLLTPGQQFDIIYDGSQAVTASLVITASAGTTTVATIATSLGGLTATRYDLGSPSTVQPAQIAVGPDHNIWWVERTSHMIGRIDPLVGLTSLTHFNSGFTSLVGIAPGGDGDMWFSNGATMVNHITMSGILGSPIVAGVAGSAIGRMIEDADGNVWYEDSGATTSRFGFINTSTLAPTNFGMTTTHPLLAGTGLALGADHAIYFVEPVFSGGLSNVGRVTTPANGTPGTYSEYPIPNTSSSVFPFDIASGSDNKIWVPVFASNANNQFYLSVNDAGNTMSEYAGGIDPAAFANLVTMTAGPDGNLWIAEGGGAVRITPSAPTSPVTLFFNDNAQTTMTSCISGPDGALWCTAQGSGPNPGFTATNDSIVTWRPR